MTQILNTWTSNKEKKQYFNVENPIFEIGEYSIYQLFNNSFITSFKGVAVNQLAGLNKDLAIALHENKPPKNTFIFDRAKENIKKGISIEY